MVTNAQRALWTFLIYSIAAPFFAAVIVVAYIALARGLGVASLVPESVSGVAEAGIAVFVWSALPAALTAVIVSIVVWRTGALSWLAAAAIAVIVFAAAALLLPLELHDVRPYLAFLAGVVSISVRQVLIQADIIPD